MEAETVLNSTEDMSLFYSASRRLASHVWGFPARMLARMRKLDDILNQNPPLYASTTAENAHGGRSSAFSGFNPMPGPWGFLTSGYFVGVFVMVVLLNRIQNIVVPPRNMSNVHHARRLTSYRRRLLRAFLPVDLSSTFSRSLFRIPSIYLLGQASLMWIILLLQTSNSFPSLQWSWLQALGSWIAEKSMEDICWFTFTSACIALIVSGITRGMEGTSGSQAPFNLFAFAFHLYIYSSPLTHVDKTQGTPSRPDPHVIFTVFIPLLQLTLTHCLEVKQSWGRLRLIPTTICGVLTLVHFHSVIWTSPTSYPLTNYVPCIVESLLLCLILLTIALNALTQLLLEGEITRPLFGHAASLMPKWEEDFSVVLFRLGTASLEATSVAGLSNEVGSITVAGQQSISEKHSGTVEIDRAGFVNVSPAFEGRGKSRVRKRGFSNDVNTVRAQAKGPQGEFLGMESVLDVRWQRELGTFVSTVHKVLRNVWRKLCAFIKRQPLPLPDVARAQEREDTVDAAEDEDADSDVYERFLRGESLSDVDDDDFDPQLDPALGLSQAQDTPASLSDDEEGSEEDLSEPVQLFSDLSNDASASNSTSVLLAHMTNASASPLTRRRYTSLISGNDRVAREDVADDWDSLVVQQRELKLATRSRDDDGLSESRRNCVVCTVEPRDIICWPCRCLALCDDCRGNLASRASAAKHTCPCCRRSVEGYSKIYIP